MESLSVAIWRICLIKLDGFYRIEYLFRPLKVQRGDELPLGVLRVPYIRVQPQRLRHHSLLDLGQIPLQPRHTIALRSPPDAAVSVEFLELFRRNPKIVANRRSEFLSGWTRDFVGTLAVIISRRQIARRPIATRIVVGIPVSLDGPLTTLDKIRSPFFRVSGIDQNEVMIFRKMLGRVLRRENLLPDCSRQKIILAEHLVHQRTQPVDLIVVDGNEDSAIVPKQLPQQLEAGEHHAAPLVVASQIFAIHDPAQPLPHHGRVDLVVISPTLVAGVVGRIDVDALHLAMIGRQQRLERRKIVPLHDQVVMQARLLAQSICSDR